MVGSPAIAGSDPIPGIDIIVMKKPGGIAMVETVTDPRGRFTLRIKAAGRYTLSSACPAGMRPCPAQLLSVYLPDRRPASPVRLIAAADGSYDVIVANGETALTGVVCTTGAGIMGQKSIINTSRGNIKRPTVAAVSAGDEAEPDPPSSTVINTSRSNIKHPSVTAVSAGGEAELPGAAINTSRSNIKRPSVTTGSARYEAESPNPCDPKNQLRRGGFIVPLIAIIPGVTKPANIAVDQDATEAIGFDPLGAPLF